MFHRRPFRREPRARHVAATACHRRDLQRRDAGTFDLALGHFGQHLAASCGDAPQVVQLHVDPIGDDAPLLYLVGRRVGIDLAGDAVVYRGLRGQLPDPLNLCR